MFSAGEIIDGRFIVAGVCSDTGGMGNVLFVEDLNSAPPFRVVLKYCKENLEELVSRFRREVRLLDSFKGNSKVVQIWAQNLDHDPPYFVMKYYEEGDLTTLLDALRASTEEQERCFLRMIDCVQELHSQCKFHRDIKPQNFLREGDSIVVADLGLSTEVGSKTAFTRSSMWWGTQGYIPPEFLDGGFKHADASGDIFMLGKSFYVLLTGRDPTYLTGAGIAPPVFYVIERCCSLEKHRRYQSLAELKQSLATAYDVMLGRAGGKAQQFLSMVKNRLAQSNQYDVGEVQQLIEEMGLISKSEQVQICFDLPSAFFAFVSSQPLKDRVAPFLRIYEVMVEDREYSWPYAETIAINMRTVFRSTAVEAADRAHALDLAIRAADYMNRFAAMNTCTAMVQSVKDEELALHVSNVLINRRHEFIAGIEPSTCQSEIVRGALRQIRQENEKST
jgi:eukaryotic-like serine/threonine-protein kinase